MPVIKLTRFVHSCLLVETDGESVLFDPGMFSIESLEPAIGSIAKLDYLVVTHEHPDHFHPDLVTKILKSFPDTQVITVPPLVDSIKSLGASRVGADETKNINFFIAPHEELSFGPGPENLGVHVGNILSNPGDSHSFSETKPVLCMPITAPWGSMANAAKLIKQLKPKIVMPVHDWHWRPEAISDMYGFFKNQLAEQGIEFLIPVDAQSIDINL